MHPDLQTKLYEEIKQMMDETRSEHIDMDMISKMNYLDQVFKESMRIFPAAGLALRATNGSVELGKIC